jgi:hypothetical protein
MVDMQFAVYTQNGMTEHYQRNRQFISDLLSSVAVGDAIEHFISSSVKF